MRNSVVRVLVICLLMFVGHAAFAEASFFGGSETLVEINDNIITKDDFRHWWNSWKEDGTPFPTTIDSFVNWNLLAQQANDMELYKRPGYQKKLQTYLNVRGMMFLKYDEVDSKIKITDKELRDVFSLEYSPVYDFQALVYDNKEKSDQVYSELQKFDGNIAGRLIFSDYQGVKQEEGGPVAYKAMKLNPKSFNKNKEWLDIVSGLKNDTAAVPYYDGKFYIIFRLNERIILGEEEFDKEKEEIKRKIWKEYQAKFTADLVEKLRNKYNVVVDQEVYEQVKQDATYTDEFLAQNLLTINGEMYPVAILVSNINNEAPYRNPEKLGGYDKLKYWVFNGMISQTLISIESLNRHYEEHEPFKWSYEFYQKNRLIKELESGFIADAKVTKEEILDYYNAHIDEYSIPPIVSLAVFEDEEKLVDKIWEEVVSGNEFFDVVRKYSRIVSTEYIERDKLNSPYKEVVENLVAGEVSPPFEQNGRFKIIKLVNTRDASALPIDKVRDKIVSTLEKDKFAKIQDEYIQKLRNASQVTVNEGNWKALQKEFGVIN